MMFRNYLTSLRSLYREGVLCNFHPDLLRRYGGGLALAAKDQLSVQVEQDAVMWFDVRRNPAEMWASADQKWLVHQVQICRLIEHGRTPAQAIHFYMRKHHTYPHNRQQMQQMLQRVVGPEGIEHSAWMSGVLGFRRRFNRGARVMSDTFGAITTMVALSVTARDWQNATPEEWNQALNVGEVGALIGQMAGAHADARSSFADAHRSVSRLSP